MLDDETIVFLIVLGIAFVVFVIVLNPYFWQGFHNAKYWDDLKEKEKEHKHEDTWIQNESSNASLGKDIKSWTDSTC